MQSGDYPCRAFALSGLRAFGFGGDLTVYGQMTCCGHAAVDGQGFGGGMEGERFVAAEALEAVEGVHGRAHEEGSEAEVTERSQDAQQRVFEGEGLAPEGSVGVQELVGRHVARLEGDVVPVVKLPAAGGEDSS